MNIGQREERFEKVGEKFFAKPAERQTRECNSELARGKISLKMGANIFRETRPRIPLLRQRVELTRANFDDRELTRDEKSVQRDQTRDHHQFSDNDPWRVPLRDRNVCERKH